MAASFGYLLSYCIKPAGAKVIARPISPKAIRSHVFDRDLCVQFLEDVKHFDRLIGYYSSRFDVPFLRTRCIYWGLEFPPFGSMYHTDAYYSVRHKLRLHRNRLETACELFGIPSKGHRLNPSVWQNAMTGDQDAIDFVLQHNIEDVVSLEQLWDKFTGQVKVNKTSL